MQWRQQQQKAVAVEDKATLNGPTGSLPRINFWLQRHDGHAVTCDDFLAAMADANDEDLSALARCMSS